MKKEQQSTLFSIIINILVTISKICGGMSFNSYTLISGGYYSLCNLSEEMLAYIGSKIRGRRASIKFPFGFGKMEYSSQIAFGLIFIFLAIYVFIKTFFLNFQVSNYLIIFIILFVILLNFLSANYLLHMGKIERSQMLFAIAHKSYYDALITIFSLIFIFLSMFISFFDSLGSIFISLTILYRGIKIVIDNIILIKGQNDISKKISDKIKKIVNKNSEINYSNLNLVNIKNFYAATIEIEISDKLTMMDVFKIENKIRKQVKKDNLDIKIIDFEIYEK